MNDFEKNNTINNYNLSNVLKNYLDLNISPNNIVNYYKNVLINNYEEKYFHINEYNYHKYFKKFSYIDNSFPNKFISLDNNFVEKYLDNYLNKIKFNKFGNFDGKIKQLEQPKLEMINLLDFEKFHNFVNFNKNLNIKYTTTFYTTKKYINILCDNEKTFLISYLKKYTKYTIPDIFFSKNGIFLKLFLYILMFLCIVFTDLYFFSIFNNTNAKIFCYIMLGCYILCGIVQNQYKNEKEFVFVLEAYLKYKKEITDKNSAIKDEYNKKKDEYNKKNLEYNNYISKLKEYKEYEIYKKNELKNQIYFEIEQHNNKIQKIIDNKIHQLNDKLSVTSLFETDKLKQLIYLLPLPFFYLVDLSVNYNFDNNILIINYKLPLISDLNDIYYTKYSINRKKYLYENLLYQITFVIIDFCFKISKEISSIVFNGYVDTKNTSTGKDITPCILSLLVDRKTFEDIDLRYIEPKDCFKALKGVKPPKFENIVPITPIMTFDKNDKRFVKGYDVINTVNQGNNLANMDWKDFENLVRDLFELEFNKNGGEVKITQASRDGGVDAIAFDPDPIRGGKIIIQAKRYTNAVGVSAVRDLYGTVVNEGANKGILITTAGYGSDAYNFAKDKPLTLLDGGHLLGLLEKHGIKAYINLQEAKNLTNKLVMNPL